MNISKGALAIPGWMSGEELYWLQFAASEMESVVELGSYLGRSTLALAKGCNGPVYAIDNWATVNEQIRSDEETLKQFLVNVEKAPNVNAVRKDVNDAAKDVLSSVDMVFLDAAHDYDSVKANIEAWRKHTRRLFCGHDADLPEVWRAVKECFPEAEIVVGSIWAVKIEINQ